METPVKTFWLMNFNIDRVRAQGDIRALNVAMYAQAGEQSQELRERLVLEVGEVIKVKVDPIRDAVRDEAGFAELKEMAKQMT